MDTETPVHQALRAALSPDPQVRLHAALRLGTLADASVAAELVTLLVSEPDPFVRETLTWAVVRQSEAAVPTPRRRSGRRGPLPRPRAARAEQDPGP